MIAEFVSSSMKCVPSNMALLQLKDANGNTLHPSIANADLDPLCGVTSTNSIQDDDREYKLEDSFDRLALTELHEVDQELGEFGGGKRTISSPSQNAVETKRRFTEVCPPPNISENALIVQRTSLPFVPSSPPGATNSLQTKTNGHKAQSAVFQLQHGHQRTSGPEEAVLFGSDLTGSVEADGAPVYSPEDRRRINDIEKSLIASSPGSLPPLGLFEVPTPSFGNVTVYEARPPPESPTRQTVAWATSPEPVGPPTAVPIMTKVGLQHTVKGPPSVSSLGLNGVTGPPSDPQPGLEQYRDSGLSGSDSSLNSEKAPSSATKPHYSSASSSFPPGSVSMSGSTTTLPVSGYWPMPHQVRRTPSVCSSTSSSSCKSKDSGHELSPASSWDTSPGSPASESDGHSSGGWVDPSSDTPTLLVGSPSSEQLVLSLGVSQPVAFSPVQGQRSHAELTVLQGQVRRTVSSIQQQMTSLPSSQMMFSSPQHNISSPQQQMMSSLPPYTRPSPRQQMQPSSPQQLESLQGSQIIPSPPPPTPPMQQAFSSLQQQAISSAENIMYSATLQSASLSVQQPTSSLHQQVIPVSPQQMVASLPVQMPSSHVLQTVSSPSQQEASSSPSQQQASSSPLQRVTLSPQQQMLAQHTAPSPQQQILPPPQHVASSPIKQVTPSPHPQTAPSPAQEVISSPGRDQTTTSGACLPNFPAHQLTIPSPAEGVSLSSAQQQLSTSPSSSHSNPVPNTFSRQGSQPDVIFGGEQKNADHCCCCCHCEPMLICRGPGGSDEAGSSQPVFSQERPLPVEVLQTACNEHGIWLEDEYGDTILHALSAWKNEEAAISNLRVLKDLPEFARVINKYNKSSETPLFNAVCLGKVRLVDAFLRLGADVNLNCHSTNQTPPLHHAVEKCSLMMVNILLRCPYINIDAQRPSDGCTPLLVALMRHVANHPKDDCLQIIEMLVQAEDKPNFKAVDVRSGKTVMMYAVETKDPRVLDLILSEVGATLARELINMTNRVGNTAVHLAAGLHDDDIKEVMLRKLIRAGGETNKKNSEGDSPRDWARNMVDKVAKLR